MPSRFHFYGAPESLVGAVLLSCLLSCLLGGCARGATPVAADRLDLPRRAVAVVHEPCDVDAAARSTDVSGDGRPDFVVVTLPDGRCEAYDLNFDGRVDLWAYFAADGAKRRTESDYDRDGRVDEVVVYERGQRVRALLATSLAGQIDTWQTSNDGRLARMERDADGDAVVDQWWEFPGGQGLQCALVHMDIDKDGLPDPGATVDLCPSAPDAGESAPPVPRPTRQGVPVELDSGPAQEGPAEPQVSAP